jgi:hypothetical protein
MFALNEQAAAKEFGVQDGGEGMTSSNRTRSQEEGAGPSSTGEMQSEV